MAIHVAREQVSINERLKAKRFVGYLDQLGKLVWNRLSCRFAQRSKSLIFLGTLFTHIIQLDGKYVQ